MGAGTPTDIGRTLVLVHPSAAATLELALGLGAVVALVWVGLGVPSILPLRAVGFAAEKRGGRRG